MSDLFDIKGLLEIITHNISRRETLGPWLVAIGILLFYLLSINISDNPSPLIYGLAVLLGIVVLAGVVMTFQALSKSEKRMEATPLPVSTDDIEYAITQLNKNYDLLRRQTTQGFLLASGFMILGLLVIVSGSLGELFGLTTNGSSLTSVAGIVLEFISGTALYIYNANFKRVNQTSDQLNDTWKILTAFRKVETLPDTDKTEVTKNLINALITK